MFLLSSFLLIHPCLPPAGVNLPARLVLITSPHDPADWSRPLSPATLRQMMGRAGRAGLDAAGLAVVAAGSAAAAARLGPLLAAPPEPAASALHGGARGMARAMLEVVSAGAVASPADVQRFIRCTLLAATRAEAAVARATKEALRWLCAAEQGMIAWSDAGGGCCVVLGLCIRVFVVVYVPHAHPSPACRLWLN
jgi:DNA polymerase theta